MVETIVDIAGKHRHTKTCKEQTVPYFYGLFETLDPSLLGDHPASSKKTRLHPTQFWLNASPMQRASRMLLRTISPELKGMTINGLQRIQCRSHTERYEPPKVLAIPQDTSQRVLWVDFDVSIVFPTERTRGLLSLNDEAEWELSMFKSCVRKLRGLST